MIVLVCIVFGAFGLIWVAEGLGLIAFSLMEFIRQITGDNE